MILTPLAEAARYGAIHPGVRRALACMERYPLASLEPGRHEWEGDRLFVLVAECEGRGRELAPLEAHRKYIDMQIVLSGTDVMGWRATSTCTQPRANFDLERDIVFFDDQPESWFQVLPQYMTIFFPSDAHAPLAGSGSVCKAVVKVACHW